jgi:hypothetical protein
MEPRVVAPHAETVRSVLDILGPRPRARIALMLQGLGLSEAGTNEVLAYGLQHGLFELDPTDPDVLRAVPRAPSASR